MFWPPALVATKAAATTRSRTTSGNWWASDIMVMPPMEWPIRTSGPSGAASSITRCRSAPSWSIVHDSAGARSDWPWLRWSQSTTRYPASTRAFRCSTQLLRLRV